MGSHVDQQILARFCPVTKTAAVSVELRQRGNDRAEGFVLLGGSDVEQGHAQKFSARIPITEHSGVVDIQKAQGGYVVDPHMGVGLSMKSTRSISRWFERR